VGELAKKVFEAFRVPPAENGAGEIRGDAIPLAHERSIISPSVGLTPSDLSQPSAVDSEELSEEGPVAVKVWSDILGEAIWVVADDLVKAEWPTDASVYTHTEVKILKDVGPDTRAWVHATKVMFGAEVVASGRRSEPA
jgi:hypothetical protein